MICDNLAAAYTYLRIEDVPFDRLYFNVFYENAETPVDQNGLGEHYYFNNGENLTVAYYNCRTHIVTVINEGNGRMDHTPSVNRHYLELIVGEKECVKSPAVLPKTTIKYHVGYTQRQGIGKDAPSASR